MSVKEIGGDFHLPPATRAESRQNRAGFEPRNADTIYLASGRDALHHIIKSLALAKGDRVLLPAYLCDDVIKPFRSHGLAIEFYGVGHNLQVDTEDLIQKLTDEIKVLLYIHYFGFPFELPAELTAQINPGTTVIEDASHSFLSKLGQIPVEPDVVFASYRKLLPIPNGAAVSWVHKQIPLTAPKLTRFSLRYFGSLSCRFAGAILKGIWLRRPGLYPKAIFRQLFSWSDLLLDSYPKPAGMSFVSRHILDRIDLDEVVKVRRRNFNSLSEGLKGSEDPRPMFTKLPDGVCPLGYPVLVDDRDALARHLINHQVFPPIHWELPNAVHRTEFEEAWDVSDHILTIPIDQRYGKEDMAHILETISHYAPADTAWAAGH